MKTIIAKHAGFCFGVKRALDLCLVKDYQKPVFTLGPIVHNPQVTKKLAGRGIKIAKKITDIKKGTVIIRAHGVPKSIIDTALKQKLRVIDATCPFVKKVQGKALELETNKLQVVILGECSHPEVMGIAGNLKNPIIIESVNEAKQLNPFPKIGLVSQTTQEIGLFDKIAKTLQFKTEKLKVCNTICLATSVRQKTAEILAKKVDLMIVVGGKNSGNTRRLSQVCEKFVSTHHIEEASELKKEWFIAGKICGITAGASTPDWVIQNVKNQIEEF